jgi:hypothetical protein
MARSGSCSLSIVIRFDWLWVSNAEVASSITTISGKDLSITKENDKVVVSFAYDKEIELMKPVFLLIKFEGRSSN